MSNSSLQLSLPYIQGGQAQKHITHNEAIRTLDTVVQLSVVSQATAPDAGAVDGDRYIVAPGATDDFIGQEGNIAMLETGVWAFFAAKTGWVAYDESTGGQVVFNGNDWTPTVGGANVTATDRMGINATADITNRLAVSSDASLLTHAGGGHQKRRWQRVSDSLAGGWRHGCCVAAQYVLCRPAIWDVDADHHRLCQRAWGRDSQQLPWASGEQL